MNTDRTSPEFAAAEAHFTRQQHHEDFVKAHPEYAEPNAHVHPLFAAALNSFAKPFRARVGKRRSFATSAAMVAYERGFTGFPNQPWGLDHGPAMDGYRDAEEAHAESLAAKAERRTSDWAELT